MRIDTLNQTDLNLSFSLIFIVYFITQVPLELSAITSYNLLIANTDADLFGFSLKSFFQSAYGEKQDDQTKP